MRRILLACFLAVALGVGAAQAQSLEDLRGGSGAYYTFADPTDITVEVKVWGAVTHPGLYEVRQGLPLSTLLTLAGGPGTAVRSSQAQTTLSVRLLRPLPEGRYETVFSSVMQDQIVVINPDPVVMHGDVLLVEGTVKQRTGWRDVLSVTTAITALAVLVVQLVRN